MLGAPAIMLDAPSNTQTTNSMGSILDCSNHLSSRGGTQLRQWGDDCNQTQSHMDRPCWRVGQCRNIKPGRPLALHRKKNGNWFRKGTAVGVWFRLGRGGEIQVERRHHGCSWRTRWLEGRAKLVFALGPQNSHAEEIKTRRHRSYKISEGSS